MIASNKKLPFKFIGFATSVLIVIFIIENINHRFWLNDFKVYYSAAQALISGTQVYNTLFTLGSGYYKYSPFTLILILPLSILPYSSACIIQYIFLSASVISVFLVSWYIINTYVFNSTIKNINLLLGITFVCVVNHLVRELHLGNINVVLLLLLCVSLLCILQSKPILAGMLLAIVIITKPFFILLFIPLLLRKQFRIIYSIVISLLFVLLNPALLTGFSRNIELHQEWFHTMLEHNSSFPSNNTVESLIKLYLFPHVPDLFQYSVIATFCIGYVGLFFYNKSVEGKFKKPEKIKATSLIIEWFVIIAMMPGLFKTDTQHFLLSLPLLTILIAYLSLAKNYFRITCFVFLIFMYGGNSSDMIGKVFSERLNEAGILGFSNLIILFWVIFIHFKSVNKKISWEQTTDTRL